jgi:hypothetical protein
VELSDISLLSLKLFMRFKKAAIVIMVDYELKCSIKAMHVVVVKVNKPPSILIYGNHFRRTVCVCSFEES